MPESAEPAALSHLLSTCRALALLVIKGIEWDIKSGGKTPSRTLYRSDYYGMEQEEHESEDIVLFRYVRRK